MLDAALIEKCADPSLRPPIVERFIETAGSLDPLAITVKSGHRLLLVPTPNTPDEAMEIVRQYVGKAVVRVGLTQLPAGVGIRDPSKLKPDLVDSCENLRLGTAMFAKVMRIVAKWYGNPPGEQALPQVFEDAVYAWKTGEFEGVSVFQAKDPDGASAPTTEALSGELSPSDVEHPSVGTSAPDEVEPGNAGIRIDLTRIRGGK